MPEVYDATAELVTELEPVPEIPETPAPASVKKRRKPAAKPNRLPQDCYMEDPKKMTDKERIDVIAMFQNQMEDFRRNYAKLDETAQSAFAQARTLRDKNEKLRRESQAKINLLKQNIATTYQNSILISTETGE